MDKYKLKNPLYHGSRRRGRTLADKVQLQYLRQGKYFVEILSDIQKDIQKGITI